MQCSRAQASHPRFFLLYYFLALASGFGTRCHCRQICNSALDHGPSRLTQHTGAGAPREMAELVFDAKCLHLLYLLLGLSPVPCPPLLPPLGRFQLILCPT